MNLQFQHSSLEDPLTGRRRPINEKMIREIELNFRHDIPGGDWAWGARFYQYRQSARLRLDERVLIVDAPGSLSAFIEHKDVMGLTVRATVDNLFDTNERLTRTFFDGRRNAANSNIRFIEDRDRFYGPVLMLTISGSM